MYEDKDNKKLWKNKIIKRPICRCSISGYYIQPDSSIDIDECIDFGLLLNDIDTISDLLEEGM